MASDGELHLLRDLVPYIVYTFDLRTHATHYLNRHVSTELGYQVDAETLGREFVAGLLHPEDAARLPELVARWDGAPEDAILETEYRMRHADGSWRWFLGRDKALERDAMGRVVRIIGTTLDITVRKQLEAGLRRAAALESLGNVAGSVAHDFGNLLMVLTALVEASQGCRDDAARLRTLLDQVGDVARQGAALTRTLMGAVRVQPARPNVFDVGEAVQALAPLMKHVVSHPVVVATTGEPLLVRMDQSGLHRSLLNLVANARDAITSSGTITVSVEPFEGAVPEHPAGRAWVRVAVGDDGEGMSPDVLRHVFEPFFTTKPVGQGTGLGLASVQSVAREAGGVARVSSAPGRGTTVELLLPRQG